jgi:hypothetical protein
VWDPKFKPPYWKAKKKDTLRQSRVWEWQFLIKGGRKNSKRKGTIPHVDTSRDHTLLTGGTTLWGKEHKKKMGKFEAGPHTSHFCKRSQQTQSDGFELPSRDNWIHQFGDSSLTWRDLGANVHYFPTLPFPVWTKKVFSLSNSSQGHYLFPALWFSGLSVSWKSVIIPCWKKIRIEILQNVFPSSI